MKKQKFIERLKNVILIFLFLSMLFLLFSYIDIKIKKRGTYDSKELPEEYLWVFSGGDKAEAMSADKNMLLPKSVMLMVDYSGFAAVGNNQLVSTLYSDLSAPLESIFSDSYICRTASHSDWQNVLHLKDFVMIDYGRPVLYPAISLFLGKSSNEICGGDIKYIEKLILFSDTFGSLKAISKNHDGTYSAFAPTRQSEELARYDFNSHNLAAYTVNTGFVKFSFNSSFELEKAGVSLPSDYPIYEKNLTLKNIEVSNPLSFLENTAFLNNAENIIPKEDTFTNLLSSFNVNPNISGVYSDGSSKLIFVNEYMRLETSADGSVVYTASDISDDERAINIENLIGVSKSRYNFDETVTAASSFISKLFHALNIQCIPSLYTLSREGDMLCAEFYYLYEGTKVVSSVFKEEYAARLVFDVNKLVRADINLINITEPDIEYTAPTEVLTVNSNIIQKAAFDLYLSKFPSTIDNPVLAVDNIITLSDFTPVYFVGANGIYSAEWTAIS